MGQQFTTDDNVKYWDARATRGGNPLEATLLDMNMRALEIETVASWLEASDRLLEVFCGNAVTTIELSRFCSSVTGFDLSEKMLEAGRGLIEARGLPPEKVALRRGSVLDLPSSFRPGEFSAVVSIRGLINLPSWELQQQALLGIHALLPPGGKLLLLEGSREGLEKINSLRAELSLPPIGEPWYDNHFSVPVLREFLARYFDTEETRNLDTYFLISRVLYPAAAAPHEPRFDHLCNTVARLCVPYLQTGSGATLLYCAKLRKR